ncbi:ATP synthase F(0) complex subunit B1, mitochondrial-like [Bolinopsis microptera]|uniref:ATP synthase F(0) complex subunit B1, mitochondrial-like n=1 Tax=Bolinopsis microptera TaxID=2820187 RepID=UPI003079D377
MLSRTCLLARQSSKLPLVSITNRFSSDVAEVKASKNPLSTGQTGAAVLGGSLLATAVSKEMIVLDADVLAGAILFTCTYGLGKKIGPMVIDGLDKYTASIETTMSEGKQVQIAAYEEAIAEEKAAIESLQLAGDIFDIKRELVQIEIEAEYRRRIKTVHTEVKKRLDYQVELENTKKAFIRNHIVAWLEKEVIASISAEQEEANINQCIASLSLLAPSQ